LACCLILVFGVDLPGCRFPLGALERSCCVGTLAWYALPACCN